MYDVYAQSLKARSLSFVSKLHFLDANFNAVFELHKMGRSRQATSKSVNRFFWLKIRYLHRGDDKVPERS